MPEILSMIQVNKMTPAPAVLVVVSLLRIKVSPRVILFLFIEIFPQKSCKETDNNRQIKCIFNHPMNCFSGRPLADIPDLLQHFRPDKLHGVCHLG